MTSSRANDALATARGLARQHGFLIATVTEYRNPASILDKQPYTAFVLYRNRVRLGRRSSPSALLRLLKDHIAAMNGGAHP